MKQFREEYFAPNSRLYVSLDGQAPAHSAGRSETGRHLCVSLFICLGSLRKSPTTDLQISAVPGETQGLHHWAPGNSFNINPRSEQPGCPPIYQ